MRIEGGQGGKRGHSGMEHWEETEIIKERSRKKRREQSKKIIINKDEH